MILHTLHRAHHWPQTTPHPQHTTNFISLISAISFYWALCFGGLQESAWMKESAQQSNSFQANDFYKVRKELSIFWIVLVHESVSYVSLIHTSHMSRRWIFCNKGNPKKMQIWVSELLHTLKDGKKIFPHWWFSYFILPKIPFFLLFCISLNTLGFLLASCSIFLCLFNYYLTRYFFSCSNFSSYFLIFLFRLWRCLVSCATVCGSLHSSQLHLEELLGLQKPEA